MTVPSQLQWGHAFSSVERSRETCQEKILPKLQWGHAFSSVESGLSARSSIWLVALQWGHAFSSVESVFNTEPLEPGGVASMGPRFFKRGEIGSFGKAL